MKIISQNTKKIISVLGIPRSGTTIVCNIFNSMTNAFCLSEPHWTLLSNPKDLRFDKTQNLSFLSPSDILPKIKLKLITDNTLQFAGVKETYRPNEQKMKKYYNDMLNLDIIVFVFREPMAHYNSFKVMAQQHHRNPMPLQYIIHSFNALYNLATAKYRNGNGILLLLEDLCIAQNDGAIQYINNRAKNIISIHGQFNIKPSNYIYGNHKANNSDKLEPANMATHLLTQTEMKIINRELSKKYKMLQNLDF